MTRCLVKFQVVDLDGSVRFEIRCARVTGHTGDHFGPNAVFGWPTPARHLKEAAET